MSKLDEISGRLIKSDDVVDEIHRHLDEEAVVDVGSVVDVKPVVSSQKLFSSEERHLKNKDFVGKLLKNGRVRRRERKMAEHMEYDKMRDTRGVVIAVAVIGLIFIMFIRDFLPDEALYLLIILIGCTMFMPIGMIAGWLLFDPFMRCKVLRKATKRNFGIIMFVGKGGKLVSKIKNFDQALIWKNNECWVLDRDRLYQIDKDGNKIVDGKQINADSVVTLVDTVPMFFVDLDSMVPLALTKEGRVPVMPLEIGSSLKAWTDNQRAKMLGMRKTMDIIMMVTICASAAAVVICVLTLQKVEDMTVQLTEAKRQLDLIVQHMNLIGQ